MLAELRREAQITIPNEIIAKLGLTEGELLAENPFHPSLRTKRIQGATDLFECSVNMDIRIIWYYEGDKMIIVVDVGHHDMLKQF